jgi:hypothetical protein
MDETTPPRGHTRTPPVKDPIEPAPTLETVHALAKGTASKVASLLTLQISAEKRKKEEKLTEDEEKKKVSEVLNKMLEMADEVRTTTVALRKDYEPVSRNQRFIAVFTGSSFTASAVTLLIHVFTDGKPIQLYLALAFVVISCALLIAASRFVWRA